MAPGFLKRAVDEAMRQAKVKKIHKEQERLRRKALAAMPAADIRASPPSSASRVPMMALMFDRIERERRARDKAALDKWFLDKLDREERERRAQARIKRRGY